MKRPILFLAALLLSGPALADGLSPVELARVQQAERAAQAKVLESMGKKDLSELKGSERAAYIRKEQEALTRVHKELKVDSKAYARQLARLPVKERKELELASSALEKEAEAAAKASAEQKTGPSAPRIIEIDEDGLPKEMESTTSDRIIEVEPAP